MHSAFPIGPGKVCRFSSFPVGIPDWKYKNVSKSVTISHISKKHFLEYGAVGRSQNQWEWGASSNPKPIEGEDLACILAKTCLYKAKLNAIVKPGAQAK